MYRPLMLMFGLMLGGEAWGAAAANERTAFHLFDAGRDTMFLAVANTTIDGPAIVSDPPDFKPSIGRHGTNPQRHIGASSGQIASFIAHIQLDMDVGVRIM